MVNIKEKVSQGYFHISIIIEIAGRPPEHVTDSLKKLIKKISEDKNIELLKEIYSKPTPTGKLFTAFVEAEFLIKGIRNVINLVIDYMPSSLEIISPQEFKMKSRGFTNFINDLIGNLHKYDAFAKRLNVENMILKKHLEDVLTKIKEGKADEIKKRIEENEKKLKKEEKKNKNQEEK